jgi:hypothetical protein
VVHFSKFGIEERGRRVISAGNGAASQRQLVPAITVRERGRQPQDEPAHLGDHLHTDLEQVEAQCGDLRPRPGGAA